MGLAFGGAPSLVGAGFGAGVIASANGNGTASPQALDEVIALTRRLRMPYMRDAALDVVPTARAQRWDPADVLRVLLSEEIAGRDAATLRMRRRRANFPAGKTFEVWDESRITVAARNRAFSTSDGHTATMAAVAAYRMAMADFARMRVTEVWYARMSEHDFVDLGIEATAGEKKQKSRSRSTAPVRRSASCATATGEASPCSPPPR